MTYSGNVDAQLAFVRSGFGWSIISEIATREAVALAHIDVRSLTPPLFRDLALVLRSDRAARSVIAVALAVFANHAAEDKDTAPTLA